MFKPTNEQGLIVYFAQEAAEHGWEFVSIGTEFPDAVLKYNDEHWRVEFEYKSMNFWHHRHDDRKCDLIICWEDNYIDCPLPVLALAEDKWRPVKKMSPASVELEYWKRRALLLEKRLNRIGGDIDIDCEPPVSPQKKRDEPLIQLLVDMVIKRRIKPDMITVQYIRHKLGKSYNGKQIYPERAKRIKDAVESMLDSLGSDGY